MEPAFLITLLALGLAIFFAIQVFAAKSRSSSEDKIMKGYFLLGLSGLMSKIAMADGSVTTDEVALTDRLFNQMDLTDAERALCIGNFVSARRDGLEARDHAKRFMAYANSAACEFLYDILWRISRADCVVDPKEDELLKKIATYLGLSEATYQKFKAGETSHLSRSELKAAGVPPSLLALAR